MRELTVDFTQNDVNGAKDGDGIGDFVANAGWRQRIEVDVRRGSDVITPGIVGAIRHDIETQLALWSFNRTVGFAFLDASHIRWLAVENRAVGKLIKCLFEDFDRLADFAQTHQITGIHIATVVGDSLKIEAVVNAIRTILAKIVIHARTP